MFLRVAEFSDKNQVASEKERSVIKGDNYKWIWYLYDDTELGKITEANNIDLLHFTSQEIVWLKLS